MESAVQEIDAGGAAPRRQSRRPAGRRDGRRIPTRRRSARSRPATLPKAWIGPDGRPTAEALDRPFPKFTRPENILIVVAGGTAGKFSAAVGGWASGGLGSKAVTRVIEE